MKALEISTAISFKNILFLTDFTEASNGACDFALAFARKYGATLYPGHVVEPFMVGEIDGLVTPEILHRMEAEKSEQLASLFRNAGVDYREIVTAGSVEAVVSKWTAERGIDLIVLGTHGRKGVDRFFLGSTAEAIFRNAACPVLTIGPGVRSSPNAELKFKKILLATSLLKENDHALDYGFSFAREPNAKLTVLHVIADDVELNPDPQVAAEVALDKLRALVPEELGVQLAIAEGDPAKRILDYVKNEQPDLIILGLSKEEKTSTHFRRGIAYKVITGAHCAVLTMR